MRTSLLFAALVTCAATLGAQTRYLEPVFDGVEVSSPMPYQNNISVIKAILFRNPDSVMQVPDFFQAYTPAGDTETSRPAVIINSTGSYFPQFVGGGIYGTLRDSAAVETAKRFARMGYVAFVASYRQGWNATSQNVNTRTGDLLIASYRGIQDLRSMTRFIRNNADTYGVDGEAVMALGFGTGAYNTYNNNFLDDPQEVNTLPKFINTDTGNPFLNVGLYGDPDGLVQAPLNLPQNVGAESRVNFTVGIGGAMGDTTWIENDDSEAPVVGLHSVNDQNAPFAVGDVFVPVSPTERLFVIRVDGPRSTIDRANRLGVNEPLDEVNQVLRETEDFTTVRSAALRDVAFTTRDDIATTFAVENMYPFVSDLSRNLANRYNWIDSAQLAAAVDVYNQRLVAGGGTAGPSAQQRLGLERITNPNVTSPERAKQVIDTIMAFVTPRAFVALDLGTAADVRTFTDVVDIEASDVGFELFPNPSTDVATIQVNADVELQLVALYDAQGRRVTAAVVSGSEFRMDVTELPSGMYRIYAQTSEGTLSTPMMVAH